MLLGLAWALIIVVNQLSVLRDRQVPQNTKRTLRKVDPGGRPLDHARFEDQ